METEATRLCRQLDYEIHSRLRLLSEILQYCRKELSEEKTLIKSVHLLLQNAIHSSSLTQLYEADQQICIFADQAEKHLNCISSTQPHELLFNRLDQLMESVTYSMEIRDIRDQQIIQYQQALDQFPGKYVALLFQLKNKSYDNLLNQAALDKGWRGSNEHANQEKKVDSKRTVRESADRP